MNTNDDSTTPAESAPGKSKMRRRLITGALVIGALVGSAGAANALVAQDDNGARSAVSSEQELTGQLADDVSAAALDAVLEGTIDRVETDNGDAAYEAHMTNADGEKVTVHFDEDLNVLDISEDCNRKGHRGRHGGGDGEEETVHFDEDLNVTE